jgi:tetratricopeptide (TPR) repeat protein
VRLKTAFWPIALLSSISSWQSVAAVLPEHYPPQTDYRLLPQLDPELKTWFSSHVDQLPVALLEESKYQQLLQGLDRFARTYAESMRAQPILRGEPLKTLNAALEQELSLATKESRPHHALVPYVMHALATRSNLGDQEVVKIEASILETAPQSCPGRKAFFKGISRDRLESMRDDEVLAAFARIRNYRSLPYRKQAYDIFFSNIASQKRALLKPKLPGIVQEIEGLVAKHSWLAGLLEGVEGGKSIKPLARSREESKAGQCEEAQKFLMEALDAEDSLFGGKKSADLLDDMVTAAAGTSRCLRRKGVGAALSFWTSVMPRFEKIFGFPGKAAVLGRVAYLLWNADQMDQAKLYARQYLSESKAAKDDANVLRAEFLLGRILDDNKERAEAKALLSDFVARNPGDENIEIALNLLTINRFEDREYAQALEALNAAISWQDKLPPEKRSSQTAGFALFWQGRIHLANNRKDLALHSWRRLASEYYSTYYGVLGHVLYERASGRRAILEPSRVPVFAPDFLTLPFKGEDRQAMGRVGFLLRLGMPSDAMCELREVPQDTSEMEQTSARALALYAGKEWLDAIRLMDAIPRAYRNSLPLGFERIFFPREHENLVFDYSKRLRVDPDFIFALIRQESVFNPRAQSPVGASGLMQLMPATARLEISRLSSGYIGAEKQRKFNRAIQEKSGLSDPELNVALGVHHVHRLFTTFKNPILMLSAYNASPAAAQRWSREISFDDPLIAVERIPYQETRSYVKLIMRNYFYYKRWYVGPAPQMPHIDYLLGKI